MAFSRGKHKYGYQIAAALFDVVFGGRSFAQIVTEYPDCKRMIPVERPDTPQPNTSISLSICELYNTSTMKIATNELKQLTRNAILTYGYTNGEADVIQEILLYAQLRGNNQGVVKLIGKGIPKRDKA